MNAGIAPAKLNDVADRVWRMVLGFRLQPVQIDPRHPEPDEFVLASVTIAGAWHGVLTLGCSTDVARRAAATMFRKLPQDTGPGEIRDALGELTNMVGGNFKTLLKGECRLSVPNVVNAIPNREVDPAPLKHQWFECEGGVVLLQLLLQKAGP